MTRKIGFANKKGGVGKTTSVVNISANLALSGLRVLVIDLDSQGNTTLLLGESLYNNKKGISQIYDCKITPESLIKKSNITNLDIIKADSSMDEIEMLIRNNAKITLLKDKLYEIENNYDYIFIDFPPSLSILSLNGFNFTDEIIIPAQTNYMSLDCVMQMTRLIYKLNIKINPNLKIIGILPTICDIRTRMHYEVLIDLKKNFGQNLILNIIHSDVKLAEMAKEKKPVSLFAPFSQGAKDYMIASDFISRKLQ